ncbi:MAG: hypothetical protein KAX42_07760 [Sphaerotilus sp.]|nr:hypothetical protein [Sphaerotilus sp.]
MTEHPPAPSEIHLQEGFTGQTIEVAIDGELQWRKSASTRWQTGLAAIEPTAFQAGQTLTVRLVESNAVGKIIPEPGQHWITVSLDAGRPVLAAHRVCPGYV